MIKSLRLILLLILLVELCAHFLSAAETLKSAVPMDVFTIMPEGSHRYLGGTIDGKTVALPSNQVWYVVPSSSFTARLNAMRRNEDSEMAVPYLGMDATRELALVFPEIQAQSIPGLSLSGPNRITDADLKGLGQLNSLRYLNLSMLPKLTTASLSQLTQLKSLRSLDMSGCAGFTDESLAALSGLEHLEVLNLSGTKITDAGFQHIAHIRSLRELKLEFCVEVKGAGLALL